MMMRVFVAGATGAIGRQLVPRLVNAGHEVHGMTRSESKRAMLSELGAVPVIADALDPDQVAEAVGTAKPDVIIHELTAIGSLNPRQFDPLDPSPAREMRETLAAIRHLEEAVLSARWTEGIVLRYGSFYGPGTSMAPGGQQLEMVRKGRFPLVGDGAGVWSFIHIADAAEATVAAVEHGSRGVYNIVDDDPAAVAEWLPALARELGARKPMRVPRVVGRLFAGEAGVVMMTEARGASNAKAKRELGWQPRHPSWREGFAA
jgi:nucleoside-diphosphate-sugar epimerase